MSKRKCQGTMQNTVGKCSYKKISFLVTNLFLVVLQLQHHGLVSYLKCLNFSRNPCCHLLPNINHGPKTICTAKNQNQIHCEICPFPIAYFLRKVHRFFCLNHWDVLNHHVPDALLLLPQVKININFILKAKKIVL